MKSLGEIFVILLLLNKKLKRMKKLFTIIILSSLISLQAQAQPNKDRSQNTNNHYTYGQKHQPNQNGDDWRGKNDGQVVVYNNYYYQPHKKQYRYRHYRENRYPNQERNYLPYMDELSFQSLLNNMRNLSFEDEKMATAKVAILSYPMTANQVRVILDEFSFDNSKLEFAKFAYDKVYDKQNYYTVNTAFTFSSTRMNFYRFIGYR